MRSQWLGFNGLAVVACLAATIVGCDDSDEDGGSSSGDIKEAGASVHLQANSFAVTGVSSAINKVVVKMIQENETLTVPVGVSVALKKPGGTTIDLTSLLKIDSPTEVHLESFPATDTGLYILTITGKNGAVILTNTGKNSSSLTLGTVEFAFQRQADGTFILPLSATVTLPTKGKTTGNGSTFSGLPGGTDVETRLRTQTGTNLKCNTKVPGNNTTVTITDVSKGIDASLVSGPNSLLAVSTTR